MIFFLYNKSLTNSIVFTLILLNIILVIQIMDNGSKYYYT